MMCFDDFQGKSDAAVKSLQLKELKNGRLAMVRGPLSHFQ
jgi:hypothetical protein